MMLSIRQCLEERLKLRQEVSSFLLGRVEQDWMQDLMVACGELDGELLALHRERPRTKSSELIDLTGCSDAEQAKDVGLVV